MPVPTGYSENAVDFIICHRGYYIALETKVHPNKPTALQIQFLEEVIASGGIGIVAYGLQIIEATLDVMERNFPRVYRWPNIITDRDAR